MKATMARLSHHFILCGLGRVGMEVAQHFVAESVKFIVVDPRTQAIARAEDFGYLYVQGDATRDETLISAAVDRAARGLVAATGADSDNVFITLTARGLNPELDIVARASESETQAKLMRAGASRVVSHYSIGGRRMALSATRLLAVDLFDSIFTTPKDNEFRLAEVHVPDDSPLVGVTLDQTCASIGIHAQAVKRASGEVIIGPAGDAVIEPGDGLILVGDSSKLEPLEGKPKG
jgi:voltage-gated potassium channel